MKNVRQFKIKYSTILAVSLTLAACGGGGGGSNNGNNSPNPSPGQNTINSIGFNQSTLTSSVNPNEAKTLITINAQSIKVNNAAATAEQFKNLNLSLDGANKDLFTLDKTDTSATLHFNKDANRIAPNTCANNVCNAIVKAVLSSKQAQLNANVSITYPAINNISLTPIQPVSVTPNKSKQLASFSKTDFKVNGQASTAEQFKAATFELSGVNARLFTLDKTDTSLTLTFNKAATNIFMNTCANRLCKASVTAKLDGKTARLESRVKLIEPFNVKISDLAVSSSHYFIMPGSQYCLEPYNKLETGSDGKKYASLYCKGSYVASKPAIPLTLLLVRDDGQTCIVKKADGSCDASVTALNATKAQRLAYLQKYALSADELEALDISIQGYASEINGVRVNKPNCQKASGLNDATPFNALSGSTESCKVFVNTPNNPSIAIDTQTFNQPIYQGNHNYNIDGRFSLVKQATDYFGTTGAIAAANTYMNNERTYLMNTYNEPRYDVWHAYDAHNDWFSSSAYAQAKHPMLILNNDYYAKTTPVALRSDLTTPTSYRFVQDSYLEKQIGFDTSFPHVQSGLLEGDRLVNTLYPLTIHVKNKDQDLDFNIGIIAVPHNLKTKLKTGVSENSGKPAYEVIKDQSINPLVNDAFSNAPFISSLVNLRSDLPKNKLTRRKYNLDEYIYRTSFPVAKKLKNFDTDDLPPAGIPSNSQAVTIKVTAGSKRYVNLSTGKVVNSADSAHIMLDKGVFRSIVPVAYTGEQGVNGFASVTAQNAPNPSKYEPLLKASRKRVSNPALPLTSRNANGDTLDTWNKNWWGTAVSNWGVGGDNIREVDGGVDSPFGNKLYEQKVQVVDTDKGIIYDRKLPGQEGDVVALDFNQLIVRTSKGNKFIRLRAVAIGDPATTTGKTLRNWASNNIYFKYAIAGPDGQFGAEQDMCMSWGTDSRKTNPGSVPTVNPQHTLDNGIYKYNANQKTFGYTLIDTDKWYKQQFIDFDTIIKTTDVALVDGKKPKTVAPSGKVDITPYSEALNRGYDEVCLAAWNNSRPSNYYPSLYQNGFTFVGADTPISSRRTDWMDNNNNLADNSYNGNDEWDIALSFMAVPENFSDIISRNYKTLTQFRVNTGLIGNNAAGTTRNNPGYAAAVLVSGTPTDVRPEQNIGEAKGTYNLVNDIDNYLMPNGKTVRQSLLANGKSITEKYTTFGTNNNGDIISNQRVFVMNVKKLVNGSIVNQPHKVRVQSYNPQTNEYIIEYQGL